MENQQVVLKMREIHEHLIIIPKHGKSLFVFIYIFDDNIIDINTRVKSHVYKYIGGLMFYIVLYICFWGVGGGG